MGAVVVVGAQWGDEGKGKIVDIYAHYADQVVRYGGGANAGHTLVVDGQQQIFHLMPSGALHSDKDCVLGQGTVIDPAVLLNEIEVLRSKGLFDPARFMVSERAFLVLPHHPRIDALRDARAGSLGTTKRGIGPAYEDKVARRGLRMGDLRTPERFAMKLRANLEAWVPVIEALEGQPFDLEAEHAATCARYRELGQALGSMVGDAGARVRDALGEGKRVLMEGAQGALLDIDGGTYPFVTSSSTVAGGACVGSGIGPTAISAVVGISKAYATRVGNGPFPTELEDATGDELRKAGAEFGATTGRPRRCGWLDLPALRLAAQLNGFSGLALTKIDVLTGMGELKLCTHYELDGERLSLPPYDRLDEVKPIYASYPGWDEAITECRSLEQLPSNARRYIEAIETAIGCPLWLLSVGPDREQTITVRDPFDA
ncbi:MAG: adenylosuccinate synthase [Myxococcales bacterium]|nr:adenylosuccinate synthase [Myxococcales bacterium]